MHPRRIPTFLALGLIIAGCWLLLAPYTVHATAGYGTDRLELHGRCQSPFVNAVTDDPPQQWLVDGAPPNEGFLFSTTPSPCAGGRAERGLSGLALVAGGVLLLVITRRRRLARERADTGVVGSDPVTPTTTA